MKRKHILNEFNCHLRRFDHYRKGSDKKLDGVWRIGCFLDFKIDRDKKVGFENLVSC
jgi:hypothetical protein